MSTWVESPCILPPFHFSPFTEGVREAYLDSRLFDVRLVCADGLIFWAHSLVLSVFSDFFAEMARLDIKEINLGDVNSGNSLFQWTGRVLKSLLYIVRLSALVLSTCITFLSL